MQKSKLTSWAVFSFLIAIKYQLSQIHEQSVKFKIKTLS